MRDFRFNGREIGFLSDGWWVWLCAIVGLMER